MKKEYITKSAEETMVIGQEFAKELRGGETIALYGDLGGGKTTFVKGLAEELQVADNITSPTFVMLKVYDAILRPKVHFQGGLKKVKLVHIDAYRTETVEDIKSVGIEDFLNREDVVLLIEWAEKQEEILSNENRFNFYFEFIDEITRRITIK